MNFDDAKADDAIELFFDTINITKGTFKIEQQNTNTDEENDDKLSVDPMLTITNSTFGSDYDLSAYDDKSEDFVFKVLVANLQRDKNCVKKYSDDCNGDDGCFFDYMGQVKITKNRFSFLDTEAITILNAKMLDFSENTIEFNVDYAVNMANIKDLKLSQNRFEFVGKRPALNIAFKESATELEDFGYFPKDFRNPFGGTIQKTFEDDCESSKSKYFSMKEDDIKDVVIMKNWFGNFLHMDTMKLKIDSEYGNDFVMNKFTPNETSSQRPCRCPIPKEDEDAEDEDKLALKVIETQRCLSPKFPPVLGSRIEICKGNYPKSLEEQLDERGNIKPWHLVLAIIVSIILTAVMVFLIVKFCCMSEESKSRSVTPEA